MQQENVLLPLEKWRIACEAVAKFIRIKKGAKNDGTTG